jgi:hypothetical protein
MIAPFVSQKFIFKDHIAPWRPSLAMTECNHNGLFHIDADLIKRHRRTRDLKKIVDGMWENLDLIADAGTVDNGKPILVVLERACWSAAASRLISDSRPYRFGAVMSSTGRSWVL